MTIYNLGSINLDLIYQVDHLPLPGETLSSIALEKGLGGKGANQSVAVAKGGAAVQHIGCVGPEGVWLRDQLHQYGVGVKNIEDVAQATGHAVIYVDKEAENSIVLHNGANHAVDAAQIESALANAGAGDWLLMQNETNFAAETAKMAKAKGLKIAYAAAPFSTEAVEGVIDLVDLIAVNEIEAQQLAEALPHRSDQLSSLDMLVTKGSQGAVFRSQGKEIAVKAYKVEAVDTTGAGDTYLGYFLARLDCGDDIAKAMKTASAASALQVTQPGAASAIPDIETVELFLLENSQ